MQPLIKKENLRSNYERDVAIFLSKENVEFEIPWKCYLLKNVTTRPQAPQVTYTVITNVKAVIADWIL